MLYENGLVYRDPSGSITTLIPPGQIGISTGLILSPVDTGGFGNLAFAPNVANMTVVLADDEFRSNYKQSVFDQAGFTILGGKGNHGDIGSIYDPQTQGGGLGGIYLDAYTHFFKNTGLAISDVPVEHQYDPGKPSVIHDETFGPSTFWNYHYASIDNKGIITVPTGQSATGICTSTGDISTFIDYKGDKITLTSMGGITQSVTVAPKDGTTPITTSYVSTVALSTTVHADGSITNDAYNVNGKLLQSTTTLRNGEIDQINYVNGISSSIIKSLPTATDGSTTVNTFDASGTALQSTFIKYVDGSSAQKKYNDQQQLVSETDSTLRASSNPNGQSVRTVIAKKIDPVTGAAINLQSEVTTTDNYSGSTSTVYTIYSNADPAKPGYIESTFVDPALHSTVTKIDSTGSGVWGTINSSSQKATPNGEVLDELGHFQDSTGSQVIDRKESSATGTVLYEETDTISPSNHISAVISGKGEVATLTNASIALANNASVTIAGSGNRYTAIDKADLTIVQSNGTALEMNNLSGVMQITEHVVNKDGTVGVAFGHQTIAGASFNMQESESMDGGLCIVRLNNADGSFSGTYAYNKDGSLKYSMEVTTQAGHVSAVLDGSGFSINLDHAIITIKANGVGVVTGEGNWFAAAGTGINLTAYGDRQTITSDFAGNTFSVIGKDSVIATHDNTIWYGEKSGGAVIGDGNGIHADHSGVQVEIHGSNSSVGSSVAGNIFTFTGVNERAQTQSNQVWFNAGSRGTVVGDNNFVVGHGTGVGVDTYGNNTKISSDSAGNSFAVIGKDSFIDAHDNTIWYGEKSGGAIVGDGNGLNTEYSGVQVDVVGSHENISSKVAGNTFALSGDMENVNSTGSTVWFNAGTDGSIVGSGNYLVANGTNVQAELTGNSNYVYSSATSNIFTANGVNDHLDVNGAAVWLRKGAEATVLGDYDVVNLQGGTRAKIVGAYETVHSYSGGNSIELSGLNEYVHGLNDTVQFDPGSSGVLIGSGSRLINLGNGSAVVDQQAKDNRLVPSPPRVPPDLSPVIPAPSQLPDQPTPPSTGVFHYLDDSSGYVPLYFIGLNTYGNIA